MSAYTVAKQSSSRWAIMDGEKFVTSARTKREATQRLADIEAREKQNASLLERDAAGVFVWTDEEEKEIRELVAALITNNVKRTLSGEKTFQEISREMHRRDAITIEQWKAFPTEGNGKLICAEMRWRMAARAEAFKRAGLEVDAMDVTHEL